MSIPGGIARLWRQLRNSGKRSRQVIVVARSRSPVVVVVNLVHLVWSCTMVEQSHHRAREQLLVELRVALRH
jgi:hypothetical protein